MSIFLETEYKTITCYKCQVLFAVTAKHKQRLLDTGDSFWCPNGHSQCYTESTVQKKERKIKELERQVSSANARKSFWMDQANAEARSNSTLKGHLTRKKNQLEKVKNGVCPCCNRFFKNLHRHMTNQHPDFEPQK